MQMNAAGTTKRPLGDFSIYLLRIVLMCRIIWLGFESNRAAHFGSKINVQKHLFSITTTTEHRSGVNAL